MSCGNVADAVSYIQSSRGWLDNEEGASDDKEHNRGASLLGFYFAYSSCIQIDTEVYAKSRTIMLDTL